MIDSLEGDPLDDPEDSGGFTEEFSEICALQLGILGSLLAQKPGKGRGTLRPVTATVFARTSHSLLSGRLVLRRVHVWSSQPGGGSSNGSADAERKPDSAEDSDTSPKPSTASSFQASNELLVLGDDTGGLTEKELAEQEVVVLPESGTLVFPLCQGDYVLGLLVVERDAPGRRGGPKSRRGQQTGAAGAPQAGEGLGTAYTAEEEASARPIVRSVALACAMEQRSALMRVERAARRQWVRGLVEQTRGPLAVLRTLGSMLLPRLSGLESASERDMARGILSQSERLAGLVSQLQSALYGAPAMPQFAPGSAPLVSLPAPRQLGQSIGELSREARWRQLPESTSGPSGATRPPRTALLLARTTPPPTPSPSEAPPPTPGAGGPTTVPPALLAGSTAGGSRQPRAGTGVQDSQGGSLRWASQEGGRTIDVTAETAVPAAAVLAASVDARGGRISTALSDAASSAVSAGGASLPEVGSVQVGEVEGRGGAVYSGPPRRERGPDGWCAVGEELEAVVATAARMGRAMGVGVELHMGADLSVPDVEATASLGELEAGSDAVVAVPRDVLRRAVGQVLDSALQRSAPGGTVVLTCGHGSEGWVRVACVDQGTPVTGWKDDGRVSDVDASFAAARDEADEDGTVAGSGAAALLMARALLRDAGGVVRVAPRFLANAELEGVNVVELWLPTVV